MTSVHIDARNLARLNTGVTASAQLRNDDGTELTIQITAAAGKAGAISVDRPVDGLVNSVDEFVNSLKDSLDTQLKTQLGGLKML